MTKDAVKQPIRVLVVGPHPPPNGGIATVVRNLLQLRFDERFELRLFDVRRAAHPEGLVMRAANAVTARLPPRGRWALAGRLLASDFREALDREQPDVIHVHTSYGYGFWASTKLIRLAKARGIASILHFHASSMDEFYDAMGAFGRREFERAIRLADHWIALSRSWQRWYQPFVVPERLHVVPNCIDWNAFQTTEEREHADGPRILFVGMQFARRKGVHDLIAAVPRVLDEFPNARFLLVGEDDEGVETSIDVPPGVRAALEFVGNLGREEIIRAYHGATMLVLPAYREGMPMVMLEAMASGCPVICSAINAIPEVVEDGENGVLIRPGDPAGLADAMLRLLRDGELRERIGRRASEFIRRHHDVSVQQDLLETIYAAAGAAQVQR
ncbi:MAG: glycosyltransferase family 4 protein [Myxococcota bacterium]|nr:glycosyltransferase family 4 protein [Myxococcota bacterium]